MAHRRLQVRLGVRYEAEIASATLSAAQLLAAARGDSEFRNRKVVTHEQEPALWRFMQVIAQAIKPVAGRDELSLGAIGEFSEVGTGQAQVEPDPGGRKFP